MCWSLWYSISCQHHLDRQLEPLRGPNEHNISKLDSDITPWSNYLPKDHKIRYSSSTLRLTYRLTLAPCSPPERSSGRSHSHVCACRKLSLVAPPASVTGLSSASSRHLSDGQLPSPSTSSPAYRRPDWLLFNDFSITPCAPAEVLTLFGNQKVPCLLYYSRVSLSLPSNL